MSYTYEELLELAAKAAGYRVHGWVVGKFYVCEVNPPDDNFDPFLWNPRDDDGDAFRLAVRLRIHVDIRKDIVFIGSIDKNCGMIEQPTNDDPYKATRFAIVRAAAEIGKLK